MVERDYARTPLTTEELELILGKDPLPPFLNSRHAVYKERDFAAELPSREELISLIPSEPNLLRRPILRKGKKVVIGFDKMAMESLVKS